MKKRIITLICMTIFLVSFLAACEEETSTGGYSGLRPVLERMSGEYIGQTTTLPEPEPQDEEFIWLGAEQARKDREEYEARFTYNEDTFFIKTSKGSGTGENEYSITNFRGDTYKIAPYSEGDAMSYMNRYQAMVEGVYDLLNTGGSKVGEMTYSTFYDKSDKEAFLVRLDLARSPDAYTVVESPTLDGHEDIKCWDFEHSGSYFMKGHRPVLELEKWDYLNQVFDQLSQE